MLSPEDPPDGTPSFAPWNCSLFMDSGLGMGSSPNSNHLQSPIRAPPRTDRFLDNDMEDRPR